MAFLWAASTMAVSVGSPMCRSSVSENTTEPSQQSVPSDRRRRIFSVFCPDMLSVSSIPSAHAFTRVMRFWVSVPVLSEHMTEALPKVSTAGRLRMMAFFLTRRCTPMDRTMVTMAGRPSGIAETASETAVMKISIAGMPFASPTTKMTAQAARARTPRYFPSCASFACSGVCPCSSLSSKSAIFPISVSIPVAVTTAAAVP